MTIALLTLPDFLLIIFGWLLRFRLGFSGDFFMQLEKLVYYCLFPALLVFSIAQSQPIYQQESIFFLAIFLLIGVSIGVSYLGYALRAHPVDVASTQQCGFRFNSYLAIALSTTLLGQTGAQQMAIVMGLTIPIVNFFAVLALNQSSSNSFLKELVKNPLVLATVSGLILNVLQWKIPAPILQILSHFGKASLPLGLLCVGAAIQLRGAQVSYRLIVFFTVLKLLIMPIFAWIIAFHLLDLNPLQQRTLLLYSCLPTAPAAYVLAVRMHGNGALVALLVSSSTVLSIVTIALWMNFFL